MPQVLETEVYGCIMKENLIQFAPVSNTSAFHTHLWLNVGNLAPGELEFIEWHLGLLKVA